MKHFFTLNLSVLVGVLILLSFSNISAQQTKKISLQGFLKDRNGKAVADGDREVIFKLYKTENGGTADWSETQTINIFGGVYSTALGSNANPLDGLDWGNSTYYVGVIVQGTELLPRTELTFAPYSLGSPKAQEVVCSGAVGDIKYSILAPDDFIKVNGSCWVPMDGRTLATTDKLRTAVTGGLNQIPDGSGAFIRSQEFAGKADRDPNRTSTSPIATLQADDLNSHAHSASLSVSGSTSVDGYHNHSMTPAMSFRGDGTSATNGGDGDGNSVSNTDYAGNHQHTITGTASGSTSNAGGSETRPKNLNFWVYIRIN
ncbi:hypothetical protein LV89_00631 [Arcicella aurantiaca]|uniref:Microcystin-dependent protein n=1 Tax=Arcicella aurantiaca TaxID=591202 RepID=A0A316EET4_9BACT|nr:hypothetical protein [Arcicella aurantiaca]PWK29077.1 hypothetical protein LV89_00631 [Arcicella aurantiaca]